jgi:hypothetical protein
MGTSQDAAKVLSDLQASADAAKAAQATIAESIKQTSYLAHPAIVLRRSDCGI